MASGDIVRIGGGTDWSKYTQFFTAGEIILVANNVYEEILNITGAGYLALATVIPRTAIGFLKVTVDGVITHWSQEISTTNACGLASSDFLMGTLQTICGSGAGAGIFGTDQANIKSYPSVNEASRSFNILRDPIFFNESLKIEVACSDNSQAVRKCAIGGVI